MTLKETLIAVVFFALLGASGLWAYTTVNDQEAKHHVVLDAYIAAARSGRATPPSETVATTAEGLRLLSESTSLTARSGRGGSRWSGGGDTCFEVTVIGKSGSHALIVHVSGPDEAPVVIGLGTAPPCRCQPPRGMACGD